MNTEFQKLEKNALGSMYIGTLIATVIVMTILTVIGWKTGILRHDWVNGIYIGLLIFAIINNAISPYNKIEYLTIERGIAYKLLKLSKINIVIKGALVNIELSSGYTDDATVDFVKEKYRDVYKR